MDPLKKISELDPLKKIAEFEGTKKVVSFVDEFRAFAFKGNVVDLAVGVIIGTAFGKIVDSLVKLIIMPLIGLILPADEGYTQWKWEPVKGKVILYGQFLGEVVNFLLVAFVLFVFIVKFVGWITHKQAEAAAVPPLTKDQELLSEIRDLLKTLPAAVAPALDPSTKAHGEVTA